ncbi:MAG: radical SAM protein [Clostridia bacterium]|nr:radical SAM protein [Clostridia bacterium]
MKCSLCPRRCNAERTTEGNNGGFCKAPTAVKIARADLHFWEEPPISGNNGSGAVFFSGCSLSCVYCQNFAVSHNCEGKTVTVRDLAEIFKELEQKGAENINLVTPDHYVNEIRQALLIYRPKIPIVFNSGGYVTKDQLEILEDFIDIYLLDFKYLSNDRAKKYSFAEDYPERALKAVAYASKKQPECVFDDRGIMKKGVIVRHLLMPLATNEAIKIFDTLTNNFKNIYFSMMGQFTPVKNLENYPEINRKVTKREYEKVVNHITESGFEKCFIQELSSADKRYIPAFFNE